MGDLHGLKCIVHLAPAEGSKINYGKESQETKELRWNKSNAMYGCSNMEPVL
jgi:hypothetical protein